MELKCYAAHLEQEELQELDMALVGIPAQQLVDLTSLGVHGAGKATLSPSRTPAPTSWKQQAPSGVDLSHQRVYHSPTTMMPASPKE